MVVFSILACVGAPKLDYAIPIGLKDEITLIGKTRSYKCADNYIETGLVTVMCMEDLTWSPQSNRCRGLYIKWTLAQEIL